MSTLTLERPATEPLHRVLAHGERWLVVRPVPGVGGNWLAVVADCITKSGATALAARLNHEAT